MSGRPNELQIESVSYFERCLEPRQIPKDETSFEQLLPNSNFTDCFSTKVVTEVIEFRLQAPLRL